jgi:2',3'-cyclic-nucleotide 2'-phosphodiesterase (5'-nucleotidase family)
MVHGIGAGETRRRELLVHGGEERMSRRFGVAVVLAAAVWMLGGRPPAARGSDSAPAIVVLGDLAGRISSLEAEPDLRLARLIAAVAQLQEQRAAAGLEPALVVSAGDLLGPDPLVRFMLGEPGGPEALGGLLGRLEGLIWLPGNHDLSFPADVLAPLVSRFEEAGGRCLLSNVPLDPERSAGSLGPFLRRDRLLVERAGRRIGIAGFFDPELLRAVHEKLLGELRPLPPDEAPAELLPELRAEGAASILFLAHLERDESYPRRTLAFAAALGRGVLTVANGMPPGAPDALPPLLITLGSGGAWVVGAPPHAAGFTSLQLPPEQGDGLPECRIVEIESTPPDPEAAAVLREWIARYRARWQVPIGRTSIRVKMSREEYVQYVLAAMRTAARAEVAFINTQAIRGEELFPLDGELTLDVIYRTLAYDNRLVRGVMTGAELSALIKTHGAPVDGGPPALSAIGISAKTPDKVNGRRIDPSARYRVATIEFLARGGDGILDPEKFRYSPVLDNANSGVTIRDALLAHLAGLLARRDSNEIRLDLNADFPDLWRKTLWSYLAELRGGLRGVEIGRHAGLYADDGQSALTADPIREHSGMFRGLAVADSRIHHWRNELIVDYARSTVPDQPATESRDELSFTTMYKNQAWTNSATDSPLKIDPFAEARLTTELTRGTPEDSATFRKRVVTFNAGVRRTFASVFELALGASYEQTRVEDGYDSLRGLYAGYLLGPWKLGPVTLESKADAYYLDDANKQTRKLEWRNVLGIPLFANLQLRAASDLFVYRTSEGRKWATAHTFELALATLWSGRRQQQ